MHSIVVGHRFSQVRVNSPRSQEEAPGREILVPIFGSFFHSSTSNCFICNASVNFVKILEERRRDCHKHCCGNGNKRSNRVRNLSIDRAFVGFFMASRRSSIHSSNAVRWSDPFLNHTLSGHLLSWWLSGVMNPFPAGTPMEAWSIMVQCTHYFSKFLKLGSCPAS